MKKHYDVVNEMLEVGVENLSEHLQWLLKTIIYHTIGNHTEHIHSVIYAPDDVPQGVWGEFIPKSKTIMINLEQHFHNSLLNVQDKQFMNTSIRVWIISELMDTMAHESWHAKKCIEANNWTVSDLDEYGAKANGETMWQYAEHMDVNISFLGSTIENLLSKLYKELKEDCLESDCKEWKKIQLHMMDNNINYYNPDTNIEIRTVREVFQAQVRPEQAWINVSSEGYTTWTGEVEGGGLITEEPKSTPTKTVVPDTTSTSSTPTEAIETTPYVAPVVQSKPAAPITTTVISNTVCADYDPLNDTNISMDDPFDDNISTPVQPVTQQSTTITAPIINNTKPAVLPLPTDENTITVAQIPAGMDVVKIQQIAEKVMRRIFHHVHSKCEFNTEGTYNNAGAVIEPINITDIEGHEKLFVEQDCLDQNGQFVSHMPINGMIRGLITNEGLPQYRFYMNIGGVKHKRLFSVSKNNTTKQDGSLTSWAEKTRNGHRLMSLYNGTAKQTTASIELAPNKPLGQETFKIWGQNK